MKEYLSSLSTQLGTNSIHYAAGSDIGSGEPILQMINTRDMVVSGTNPHILGENNGVAHYYNDSLGAVGMNNYVLFMGGKAMVTVGMNNGTGTVMLDGTSTAYVDRQSETATTFTCNKDARIITPPNILGKVRPKLNKFTESGFIDSVDLDAFHYKLRIPQETTSLSSLLGNESLSEDDILKAGGTIEIDEKGRALVTFVAENAKHRQIAVTFWYTTLPNGASLPIIVKTKDLPTEGETASK